MIKALATKNVAAVLLTISMVLGFAFVFAAPAKADTLSDLQTQVQALLAQIAALQGSSSTGSMTSSSCFTFTMNLKQGATNSEVMQLQKFLNSHGFTVSASGAGSAGNETSYFGSATKAAVAKFQNAYASDILTPVGLTAGNGNWFSSTRAKANALCVGGTTGMGTGTGTGTTVPTTVPTTGGQISVMAGSQPANSLAPAGAARVPFTTFTLTNNSSAAVTVNGVNVMRTGLANDAVFAGVVLIDETGAQLGNSRTFNSDHTLSAGDGFTINPGQTKTITVAGNMASSLSSYSGQVVSLQVTGISTTGTVSGSLPITGASQTINSTLSIGTADTAVGGSDLNAAQTSVNIGTTGNVGAGVRVTAGSAEDNWVKSIRWNQSGSASASDISNVVTVVDGTSYPTVLSADGKYYTTVFPGNGIQIAKGLNKEFVVKFDIVSGPARTVNFDIYKATDVYVMGGTYGYGITPTFSGTTASATTASEFTGGTPFFSGSTFTISAGTVTSLSRANEVAAQNIVLGTPNQPLGGFAMNIQGEPISVTSMNFYIATSSGIGTAVITGVRLVDESGKVVAGPIDSVTSTNAQGKLAVAFTSTVTFPTGRHVYTLQGQLPTTYANGGTVQAATKPSTNWSGATGQTTGNSISLSSLSSSVTTNTMTVRAGGTVVGVASAPAAQTIVAGQSQMTIAAFTFDGTQSGEDVRYTSMKVYHTETALTGGDATNCFAYDGATQLNNTAVLPTTTTTDYTYTFNTALLVPKGTVKTVSIKCDVPGSITSGSFSEGLNYSSGLTFTGTGVASTQSITPTSSTGAAQTGNTMTVTTSGALTVALDASSPSYAIAAGGSTGITLSSLRFTGTNEPMKIDRVALQLTGVAATSSPGNITQVTLWDGATQVGTAIFAGTRFATSTLSSSVIIPSNGYKILTVKGDLAGIGLSSAGTEGALIQVDYDGADSTGTRAVGQSSGSTINQGSSSDTAASGVRVFKSYPTIAKIAVPTTVLGTGAGQVFYRFSITANASGDVGLSTVGANIATSAVSTANGTTSVTALKLYAFTDSSFSSGVSGFVSGLVSSLSAVNSGNNVLVINQSSLDKLEIPAGSTYYFQVSGTVSQVAGTTGAAGTVSAYLSGDSAYSPVATTLLAAQSGVTGNFIWSPNATTTSLTTHADWTDGYGVVGLPAGGTDTVTLTK
ncbi:peptidoglycan-binding protein [Candidatus Kaiserbacteria bacterium]|nr:peptidoglycan-binding protein [Candidatus Kaiserbacteria bacterium]